MPRDQAPQVHGPAQISVVTTYACELDPCHSSCVGAVRRLPRGESLLADTTRGNQMRSRSIIAAAIVASTLAVTPAAHAAPPHGEGGHTHHVLLGNGECLDVDAVAFFVDDRGLHRGAGASGPDHGIWHGPCV